MSETRWKSLSDVMRERFTEENLRKHQERLKTGCEGLDVALGGGISPGLIVLGGSPGVGKSTFAIQVAEAVSTQVPVLYFSMEMTRERIAAKLISRYMFLHREELRLNKYLTADELISGMPEQYPWELDILRAIEQARFYEESVLEGLFITVEPLSASGIAEEVDKFIKQFSIKPLVMVDYLQILPSVSARNWNEKQAVEESLKQMVRLAHEEIPVILISSLSRGSYKTPMQIDSFKETGGIEYSADVLMGLQFQACHEKNMDLNEEKDRNPRKVELSILKQRYGKSGGLVRFEYDSAHDCLWEELVDKNPEKDTREESEENIDVSVGIPQASIYPNQEAAGEDQVEEMKERDGSIPRSVMCNTKVANELRQGTYGSGNRCEVFPGVYTEYDLLPGPLTCFDCDVADAIYTLLSKYERESFSTGQVLRMLSGDERQTLTEQKRHAVEESIERLRNTSIDIRCEEEMRQREIKKKTPLTGIRSFQGQFLNVRLEKDKYFFEKNEGSVMPLYAYGERTSQMISFPMGLLHVRVNGRKLSDTGETICVKRYLIRRLEILRNKRKKGNGGFRSISFREDRELAALLNLYERFPSKESRAQKRRKIRITVMQILAYYKQIHYIQDYLEADQRIEIIGKVKDPWSLPELRPRPSDKELRD